MSEAGRSNAGAPARPRWVVPATAGLLGAVAMTAALGPSLVDPTNVEWLMRGDFFLHYVGWDLFRQGPWTLPVLGATPLLIWPVGSSVGLTDSIPIAAFLFKLLDPLLPATFQFIGLWLVLCFALQGVFGALLMGRATPRPSLQLVGATLFILSPPLIFRISHAALTAHWLVLASLWLSLRDDADAPSRRLCAAWTLLLAVTAATQPYLLLMVAVLMLAAHARQAIATPTRLVRIAVHAVVALAVAWVALWQSGSLMVRGEEGLKIGGFGGWSTNLLSFVMPTEAYTLLSPGPFAYAIFGQYEGYAYLGAGTLLLGVVALGARLQSLRSFSWPRRVPRHLPLMLALLFLAGMAVGQIVTAGSRTLFRYDVGWWGPLTIFRTHGRMIWPLYYATIIGILFTVCRFRYRSALALSVGALILQGVDLAGMTRYVGDYRVFGFRDPLQSRFWTVVPPHYERLVLVPSNLCAQVGFVDYTPFALLAGRHGMGINAGVTARYDFKKAGSYCEDVRREIRDGVFANEALYIVRPDIVTAMASGGAMCTAVDGFGVCFAPGSYSRWSAAYDVVRSRLPATPEFVRFYTELNEIYETTLGRPAREVPSVPETRVEALVRYLAYRMEGCDRSEAESKALGHLSGRQGRELCEAVSSTQELPPADQTYSFAVRLDAALRESVGAGSGITHVDLEGEAVWLQAYARERARGFGEQDAREAVLAAIRAAAR